ncbi:MAG: hypothetical protein ACRDQ1_16385, partial [Sciscionella sp.]
AGTGHAAAVRFNWLGILDLVVAAAVGYLLFGFISVTPSTAPLRLLPLALIPAGPVPLAIALHIVSLRRLRHCNQAGKQRPAYQPQSVR